MEIQQSQAELACSQLLVARTGRAPFFTHPSSSSQHTAQIPDAYTPLVIQYMLKMQGGAREVCYILLLLQTRRLNSSRRAWSRVAKHISHHRNPNLWTLLPLLNQKTLRRQHRLKRRKLHPQSYRIPLLLLSSARGHSLMHYHHHHHCDLFPLGIMLCSAPLYLSSSCYPQLPRPLWMVKTTFLPSQYKMWARNCM